MTIKMIPQLKNNFKKPLCLLTLLIGLTNALITMNAYGDLANATTLIYAKPFNPEVRSRTARRGGANSLANSCTTSDGYTGTCMTRFNCMRLGGTVKGSCATYTGICCETNLQCEQVSRMKRTIIRQPAQHTNDDCAYTIEPYSSNVCQLLVEFEKFDLQQPQFDLDGQLFCIDYLEIGKYTLCGNNDGQHLYLQFNVASGIRNVPLNFHIPSRSTQASWRLVITQLECPAVKRRLNLSFLPFVTDNSLQDARTVFSTHNSDWEILAPPGCDQYFRATRGTIKSFNYNENLQSVYMPSLDYVICIKPMPGTTSIDYNLRKFSLGLHNNAAQTFGFDADCHPTVETADREEDYLMIPQSNTPNFMGVSVRPTYYCGMMPDRTSLTAFPPYVMYFKSDDKSDTAETGFFLEYTVKSVFG